MTTPKSLYASIYCRFSFCVIIAALSVYFYIGDLNKLTALKLKLPLIVKEVKSIHDENIQLQYEIELFESPIHLMELLKKPEFSHLHYPYVKDVVILNTSTVKQNSVKQNAR